MSVTAEPKSLALAAFYEAAGYRVVRSTDACWFNASDRIFHSLPHSRPIDPDVGELHALAREHGIVGFEYATRAGRGVPCKVFMVRDSAYGEHSLQRTFRQNLRRARESCEVRPLAFVELEGIGMRVNAEALADRPYKDPRFSEEARWSRLCRAAAESRGAGVLGAFVDDELASYLLFFVEDGVAYGLHLMARRELRGLRPNHLLYYEFARQMMARDDVDAVSTGTQSFPPRPSMDRFKRHAGFVGEPCSLAVSLHPLARVALCNRASRALLSLGQSWSPIDARIARVREVVQMANSVEEPAA